MKLWVVVVADLPLRSWELHGKAVSLRYINQRLGLLAYVSKLCSFVQIRLRLTADLVGVAGFTATILLKETVRVLRLFRG